MLLAECWSPWCRHKDCLLYCRENKKENETSVPTFHPPRALTEARCRVRTARRVSGQPPCRRRPPRARRAARRILCRRLLRICSHGESTSTILFRRAGCQLRVLTALVWHTQKLSLTSRCSQKLSFTSRCLPCLFQTPLGAQATVVGVSKGDLWLEFPGKIKAPLPSKVRLPFARWLIACIQLAELHANLLAVVSEKRDIAHCFDALLCIGKDKRGHGGVWLRAPARFRSHPEIHYDERK